MGLIKDFFWHYQNIDLVDINNIILETLSEAGNDIDSVDMVVPALFSRGYMIIPIPEKEVSDG